MIFYENDVKKLAKESNRLRLSNEKPLSAVPHPLHILPELLGETLSLAFTGFGTALALNKHYERT